MKCFICSLVFIFFTHSVYSQEIQNGSTINKIKKARRAKFVISMGYGAPSILRKFLTINTKKTEFNIRGSGPYILKAEYVFHKNISIGFNATYNYSNVNWLEDGALPQGGWTKYEYGVNVNEISVNIRANYHYWNRKKWDGYVGLGGGYGYIDAATYTKAPRVTFNSYYRFPNPISLECTAGLRYFIIKNVGLYTELGLGKSWILYEKYFIPEALIQSGICIRF